MLCFSWKGGVRCLPRADTADTRQEGLLAAEGCAWLCAVGGLGAAAELGSRQSMLRWAWLQGWGGNNKEGWERGALLGG